MAKAARRKERDTRDMQVGQDHPRDLSTTGPAKLEPARVEVVEGPDIKDRVEAEAFMNELVTVVVHPSADKNDSLIVEIWNNGRAQRFIRGQKIEVKRKYVEVLARCKHTSYAQEHYKDGNGYDAIRNIPQTASRFPFSVLHDANPDGAAWLEKILAQN